MTNNIENTVATGKAELLAEQELWRGYEQWLDEREEASRGTV